MLSGTPAMSIYSQEKKFYVYAYLRSKKSKYGDIDTPYYIGKGTDNRAFDKDHIIKPPKSKSKIVVSTLMNEADAFQCEILKIALFGRIDLKTGCLRNRTNGGDGISGFIFSATSIAKILATKRHNGTLNTNTPERNKHRSKQVQGKNNPFFGKKHKSSTIEKLSQLAKNRSIEHQEKLTYAARKRKEKQPLLLKEL